MKISITQLFFIVLFISSAFANKSLGQDALSEKVSLSVSNVDLKKVLQRIEKQTDVSFSYQRNIIDIDDKFNMDVRNMTLESLLNKILIPRNIKYQLIKNNHIILTKDNTSDLSVIEKKETVIPIDEIIIKGVVKNAKGEGIPGASVNLKNTNVGTMCNVNGEYTLKLPDNKGILVFSSVGFVTKEIPIANQTVVNVELLDDNALLEEVVVVGYGTVKKSDLTGSVSSIGDKQVTQVKGVANVAQTLQGLATGVQVNQASGQPGEATIIRIRGTNSIGASNSPLYVVDGLPTDGITGDLNPSDIANVEVLKDASSTAIYGSRGANGVILITTKKGIAGKSQINFNTYFGVQKLRKKIDLINASEFAQLQNEVAANDGKAAPWTASDIANLKTSGGNDWQDLTYRAAPVQNYDLSFSGGNANTKYYTSFGYFDQQGIIHNTDFNRLSYRINLMQKVNSKININTSLSLQKSTYSQVLNSNADYGGIPFQAMVMPPTDKVYDANGNYTVFTGVQWGQTNPVGMSRGISNPSNTLRILGNIQATYNIFKDLILKSSVGLDNSNIRVDYFAQPYVTFGQPGGKANLTYINSGTFVNENTLDYLKSINEIHHFEVLGGITFQKTNYKSLFSGNAWDFASPIFEDNNLQAAVNKTYPSTSYYQRSLLSFLGRVNYDYKRKYLLTVTGRYDGSSVFGESNKFGFFPSAAFAWKVIDEDFMKNFTKITNLKLRVSYGTSGNQAVNPYTTLPSVSSLNTVLDNSYVTGYKLTGLDNRNLKWESTAQFDVGVDLGLYNNRIQITADYYNKITKNLLLNVTLPPSTGFGTVLQNVGSVMNRGFEFQLITKNIVKTFNWTTEFNISHNKNKILDLGKDAMGNPITYKEVGTGGNWFPMILGQPMNQLFGQTVTGVYASKEEAVANGEPQKNAGDYKFLDYNKDGVVDNKDKHVLTHLQPKVTFGINNTFSYKRFDLSLLLVGSLGNDIVNEFRKYNLTLNGLWTPTKEAYDNRFQGSNHTGVIGDKPSVNSMQYTRDYANSLWVENGAYLRVRDITFGYNLPIKAVSSARVYISAQNLFTITKYSGYDPEAAWSSASINGWDRGVYPATKSITGGLKLTF